MSNDNHELEQKIWGVVTHDSAFTDLTYEEAILKIKSLSSEYLHTTAVVTKDAADRQLMSSINK